MHLDKSFIELRLFFELSENPSLQIYIEKLWSMLKNSEKLVDIYLINDKPTGDVLKLRNNLVKYKKLLYTGNGINVFQEQPFLSKKLNLAEYHQIPVYKKRKVYSLVSGSKFEVGKIEVFDQKYFTLSLEGFELDDFIVLFNQFRITDILTMALHNSDGQIINGYQQFLTYLQLANKN